jgi:hypothetical protein
MTREIVVTYFGLLGGWLRPHQEVMLAVDTKGIARIKQYRSGLSYRGPVYFVPDDCLLPEEAQSLGIRSVRWRRSSSIRKDEVHHPPASHRRCRAALAADLLQCQLRHLSYSSLKR